MDKLLFVEDERSIRTLYAEVFTEEGYEVITTGDGSELLELIEREKPDLIVMDSILDGHEGVGLLQEIRSDFQSLPVIMCTAWPPDSHDLESARVDFLVAKSADLSELKLKIKMALDGRREPRRETDAR